MSVSTASETINTKLTDSMASSFFTTDSKEVLQCVKFNFKIIFAFSLTILILCLFISCINVIFPPIEDPNDIITYEPRMLRKGGLKYVMCNCVDGKCNCESNSNDVEHFSNDEMYSFKLAPRSTYQSIPLLAPSEDNLFFGQQNYSFHHKMKR